MIRLACTLLLAALAFAPANAMERLEVPSELAEVFSRRHPRGVEDLRLMEAHIQAVAAQAAPATVGVEVGQNIGSGVIINAEGLVLTAAHVIGRADRSAVLVLPDGRRLKGLTLGANHEIDAGMVKITDPPEDLPFVPAAEGPRPAIGRWVIATGQPGGTLDDRSPPIRLGRVLAGEHDWICTDCTLVGGDSGGPLINMHGEVVGIHTSIGPAAIHNFHVPVTMLRENWERLSAGEVWGGRFDEAQVASGRPLLGIAGRAQAGHCLVTQVFPRSPAHKSGLQVGDVILAVDDEAVDSFAAVARRVFAKRPGQVVRLQLRRGDESLEVEAILARIREPLPGSVEPPTEEQ